MSYPIEPCDGLKTRPVPIGQVPVGTYVLLAETFSGDDADETAEPPLLLYPADEVRVDTDPDPVVWRYTGVVERTGHDMVARFDAPPDCEPPLEITVGEGALVRTVLPGEDHDLWYGPSGEAPAASS